MNQTLNIHHLIKKLRLLNQLSISSLLISLSLSSCASVETQGAQNKIEATKDPVIYPKYRGDRQKVQVLKYGISDDIAKKYPDLADKRIGWGLYNRLLDELYATGRFDFVEEKSDIQSRIFNNWAISESGAGIEESSEDRGLQTPDFLIYAEVFEFSVSSKEEVTGIQSQQDNSTIIGIQLRLVNVTDGSFIPASGTGSSTTHGEGVLLAPNMQFDQSTIGIATQEATSHAVSQLLKRWR